MCSLDVALYSAYTSAALTTAYSSAKLMSPSFSVVTIIGTE